MKTTKPLTILFSSILILWIINIGYEEFIYNNKIIKTSVKKSHTTINPQNEDDFLKIVAVGDIMLGSNFPAKYYLPNNFDSLLIEAKPYLNGDIVFGNLEGSISDTNTRVKTCLENTTCYAFRQPPIVASILNQHGFNLLSIANNHIYDFGNLGMLQTVTNLENKKINFAGTTTKPWDTLTINNIKYGFTAFAPNKGTMFMNNEKLLSKTVAFLDSISDIVIVSFHAGAEGNNSSNITRQTEIYKGENRGNIFKLSRIAIDNGADLILCHGPHIPRAVDVYNNKFIAYSLGNFCTYGQFSLSGNSGLSPLIEIYIDTKTGDFKSAKIISFKQKARRGIYLDSSQSALQEIKRLTINDFPENNLIFKGNEVYIKQ